MKVAAQVGVRYSIEDPDAYVDMGLVEFAHVLEGCRAVDVEYVADWAALAEWLSRRSGVAVQPELCRRSRIRVSNASRTS